MTKVKDLTPKQLKALMTEAVNYSWNFYEWRKVFQLKKHYRIYFKSACPECSTKSIREKTGKWSRWTFYCPTCQKASALKKKNATLKRIIPLRRKKKLAS